MSFNGKGDGEPADVPSGLHGPTTNAEHGGEESDGMETQETHLIVVVFCSVYDGNISGLKGLPSILETVVQLLGDAKSARAFLGQVKFGTSGNRV